MQDERLARLRRLAIEGDAAAQLTRAVAIVMGAHESVRMERVRPVIIYLTRVVYEMPHFHLQALFHTSRIAVDDTVRVIQARRFVDRELNALLVRLGCDLLAAEANEVIGAEELEHA